MLLHEVVSARFGCVFASRAVLQWREFVVTSHLPNGERSTAKNIDVVRSPSRFSLLGKWKDVEDEFLQFDPVDSSRLIDAMARGIDRRNLLRRNMVSKLVIVMPAGVRDTHLHLASAISCPYWHTA